MHPPPRGSPKPAGSDKAAQHPGMLVFHQSSARFFAWNHCRRNALQGSMQGPPLTCTEPCAIFCCL
jgi:hypothetical protein